jgi:cyclohexa-1,5-dienecarbonyl-CoA hydratase
VTIGPGLRVETSADGSRGSITLKAGRGNVITADLMRTIDVALDELAAVRPLKLLAIDAVAPDFSFGASIPEHAPGEIDRVLPQAHALIEKLLAFPAPTAALVRGRCLGGGFEIALACDFIFAERGAVFGLPEIALGVFPPAGSALLPARVGAARAAAAILTGAPAPAEEWQRAGLVAFVSGEGQLAADVDRWFDANLAGRSAEALRHAAAAARLHVRQVVGALLPPLERLYLDTLMQTEDAREGIAAFLEKRLPRWTHR